MKKNLLVVICLGFVVIISGCIWQQASMSKKHLDIAIFEKVNSFDPAVAFDDYSLTVTGQVYETLYHYHYLKRPYKLIPLLAEAMPEFLNGGRTLRVRIKDSVRYHDHPAFKGKPRFVKAQDFANQIKRLAFEPLKSPSVDFFEGTLKGFKAFENVVADDWLKIFSNNMKGVEVIDSLTLDIHFNRKEVQSLHYLTMGFIVPLPEEVIRWEKNDFSNIEIGTGPFRIKHIRKNQIQLEAFRFYRDERYPSSGDRIANTKNLLRDKSLKIPFLSSLNINIVTEGEKAWEKFKKKEIDVMFVPENYKHKVMLPGSKESQSLKKLEAQTIHTPSLSVRWLSFNMKHAIWGKNRALRQAIAHAIDINTYIKEVADKSKLVANSIFNPGITGYKPQKKRPYIYSISEAKKLLSQAGYPNGKGLPKLHFYTRSNKPHHIVLAKLIENQLAQIGVKVEGHIQSFREYLKKARSQNNPMDMWLDGWIYDYPDAENILQLLISSSSPALNKTRFQNAEFDEIYQHYVSQTSLQRRLEYLSRAEEIIDSEVPWIMLSYENNTLVTQKQVRNFRWASIIRDIYKYIDIR